VNETLNMRGSRDASLDGTLDGEFLVALHRDLLKIRVAEEMLAQRYREQEMRTPAHFGVGQEAVAVGVCHALRVDDVVFSHHRGHNHYLARGGDFYQLAAELYGAPTAAPVAGADRSISPPSTRDSSRPAPFSAKPLRPPWVPRSPFIWTRAIASP